MKKIKITEAQAKFLGLIKTPKNTLRITQEQYNRIFGSKIVSESFSKVDPIRVDKQIKKQFHEDETIETKPMKLSDFKKPLQGVSNSKTFNTPVMEEVEVHDQSSIEFVKFLYGKGELSEEWTEDMIREAIAKLSKSNLIVPTEDGNFKVSNSMGDPKSAMAAIKQELDTIKSQGDEMAQEIPMGSEQGIEEVDTDHPSSPDFIPANEKRGTISKQPIIYRVLYINREMALLEKDGDIYYFNYRDSNYEDNVEDYVGSWETDIDSGKNDLTIEDMQNFINDYASDLTVGVGEQGINDGTDLVKLDDYGKQYIDSVYKLDKNISSILNQTNESDENDFFSSVKKAFTEPSIKQRPNETPEEKQARLKKSLADIRSKELASRKQNGGMDEMTSTGSVGGGFTAPLNTKTIKKQIPVVNESFELGKGYTHFAIFKVDGKIATGWDYSSLYDKYEKAYDEDSIKEYAREDIMNDFPENKVSDFKLVTRNYLDKKNVNPSDTNNWYKTNVNEMLDVAGAGNFQYDSPAGLTMDLGKKNPKTKAETTPQWAGGSFVEQPECSKLNNNKEAQNGGCNTGASSLKLKKASGSVNAPSLAENKIYAAIAAKTGKSIQEIKTIIESKKGKA